MSAPNNDTVQAWARVPEIQVVQTPHARGNVVHRIARVVEPMRTYDIVLVPAFVVTACGRKIQGFMDTMRTFDVMCAQCDARADGSGVSR